MSTTTYGATNVSPRTNVYAETEMLAHALPTLVLEKFAKAQKMPTNNTDTIKWRRTNTFSAATTPLQEGITPSSTNITFDDVEATLQEYGQFVTISSKVDDLHEDPVMQEAYEQCGENAGRTKEALIYGVVRSGTNVFYGNGSSRGDVNTALTLDKQRAVVRALRAQKAMPINKVLSGSEHYATEPIEGGYIGVGHTDLERDIRTLDGFVPVAKYGSRKPLCPEEIGAVEGIRYILSADLDPWTGAGNSTANGMKVTSGNVDVYPLMYFGKDAYATVALRGKGAITPSIIPTSQLTKDDPLGQRGIVGWKMYHAAAILNDLWMVRLEVGATAL